MFWCAGNKMSGGFGRMVLVAAALVMLGGCHRDNSDQQMNLNGITVDDDTINNGTVTIRHRDSMEQETIKIDDLSDYILQRIKL